MDASTMAVNKSTRLLWLWLKNQSQMVRPTDYARRFHLDKGNASREIRFDLPALEKQIKNDFPDLMPLLRSLVRLGMFDPDLVDHLPIVKPAQAWTEMEIRLIVDHMTGKVTWAPFVQIVKQGDEEIARFEIEGGSEVPGG